MLRLAIAFLVIALIAAFLGFGVVADYSWAGAKSCKKLNTGANNANLQPAFVGLEG